MSMNGILLFDKPLFYTSHDIVDILRRKLGIRRIGHAGTLDPMATGLLVLLVGEATSAFDQHVKDDKEYEGVMTLGMVTDTQDLEGRVQKWAEPRDLSESDIRKTFRKFEGFVEQRVPRYSSAKIKGVASHRLARKNLDFDQPVKTVEIKKLQLRAYAHPDVYFEIWASKGTYIRTLCEDVGASLGDGAVLSGLRRTRSGAFDITSSMTLDNFNKASLADIKKRLHPVKHEIASRT